MPDEPYSQILSIDTCAYTYVYKGAEPPSADKRTIKTPSYEDSSEGNSHGAKRMGLLSCEPCPASSRLDPASNVSRQLLAQAGMDTSIDLVRMVV